MNHAVDPAFLLYGGNFRALGEIQEIAALEAAVRKAFGVDES